MELDGEDSRDIVLASVAHDISLATMDHTVATSVGSGNSNVGKITVGLSGPSRLSYSDLRALAWSMGEVRWQ